MLILLRKKIGNNVIDSTIIPNRINCEYGSLIINDIMTNNM